MYMVPNKRRESDDTEHHKFLRKHLTQIPGKSETREKRLLDRNCFDGYEETENSQKTIAPTPRRPRSRRGAARRQAAELTNTAGVDEEIGNSEEPISSVLSGSRQSDAQKQAADTSGVPEENKNRTHGQRSRKRDEQEQPAELLPTAEGDSREEEVEEVGNPCKCRKRKCKHKIDLGDVKNVPASRPSLRRSRRLSNTSSNIRGRINDDIFDRCFLKLWEDAPQERRNLFTYMGCLWFKAYTLENKRERVLTWIKKLKIFSKDYVFVPIVMWSHWYLVIFCHLGESLESKTRTPCILLLNSLSDLENGIQSVIRRLVADIFETEERPEDEEELRKIPLLTPEVPQQTNSDECGVFVLLYAHLFLLNAPQNFSTSDGYPYFMKTDLFGMEELEDFYKRLETIEAETRDL